MTVFEAIRRADLAANNEIERAVKQKWLEALDGQLALEVFDAHVGTELPGAAFDYVTDDGTVDPDAAPAEDPTLLVGAPFDELYVDYLVMQICLNQQEIAHYNNAAAVFSARYRQFAAWFRRTHTPKGVKALRF